MTYTKHRAFSLVELLVVICIILILAGVLFASFGGATESARAAQCLTNMRALAMAANSRAVSQDYYPSAGSVELTELSSDGKQYFRSQAGWISWLCDGNYDDGDGNAQSSSHQSNPIFPFYGTKKSEAGATNKDAMFAMTNGALWASCGRNKALYTCPEHVRYRKRKGYSAPHFSYVMNARFGWDTSKGTEAVPAYYVGIYYGTLTQADKTLMFAELPTVNVNASTTQEKDDGGEPTGLKADCVLQYKKMSKDTSAYASEGADAESIGFVHMAGKGKRCAHVAFADGHTEKLVWRAGGLDTEELTAYLCRGKDVIFNPSEGWSLQSGVDNDEE